MSLSSPGKLEGLTVDVIRRVCEQAHRDHQTEDKTYSADLEPDKMPIRDIFPPTGDQTFDRVSLAMHEGETFWLHSVEWRIVNYHGCPWTCQAQNDVMDVRKGDKRTNIPEDVIARQLNAQRPHPNPYVCAIEIEYSSRGFRAGYGIRKDGRADIWYN
jgi:hypothetical protein